MTTKRSTFEDSSNSLVGGSHFPEIVVTCLDGDVARGDFQRPFLAQHRVATLCQVVTTLVQYCDDVLHWKSSLRIVPCNINLVPRVFSLSNMAAAREREGPGTQRTKTIADWCILLRVHTCALIGLFIPKQRWLSFEGFARRGWEVLSSVFETEMVDRIQVWLFGKLWLYRWKAKIRR